MERDYKGILTSAERLYLDRLWGQLGVDPLDDRARAIELRLIIAPLKEQVTSLKRRRQGAGLG